MIPQEYQPGDIYRVHLDEQEQSEMAVLHDEFMESLENHDGPMWSLVEGDDVLGVWGTRIINGEGHTWAVLSEAARKRPVSLHKSAIRCMRESECCVETIYGLVLESEESAHRWAVRLGFREIDVIEYRGIRYRRYLWQ